MLSRKEIKDWWLMDLAEATKKLSTCRRRKVACVLADAQHRVLAVGYNGVPQGSEHCTDHPCAGALQPSGEGLDKCEATHAEQNALIQCKDIDAIKYIYCTTSPCMSCLKLFMNTPATHIYYATEYPDIEETATRWITSSPDRYCIKLGKL